MLMTDYKFQRAQQDDFRSLAGVEAKVSKRDIQKCVSIILLDFRACITILSFLLVT